MDHLPSIEILENHILDVVLHKNGYRKRSESTELAYRCDLNLLKGFLDTVGLTYTDLDRESVKGYKEYLEKKKHPVKKKGVEQVCYEPYSKATRLRNLRNLRNFYRVGVYLNYFTENPFDNIEFPPQEVGFICNEDLYTIDEIKSLFQAAKTRSRRDFCIVLLLVSSRMLPMEIVNLRWCDVGMSQERNYICNVKSRSRGKKDVLINEYAFEQLKEYRREQGLPLDTWLSDDSKVFLSRRNQPIALSTIRYTIAEICSDANLPHKSPMGLVHNNVLLGRYYGGTTMDLVGQAGFREPSVINKYLTSVPVTGVANKIDLRGLIEGKDDEK